MEETQAWKDAPVLLSLTTSQLVYKLWHPLKPPARLPGETSRSQSCNLSSCFDGKFFSFFAPRDISPSPAINIFARTRRYSASYSPLAGSAMSPGPRLTPRVSQLRQEECIDVNSREVNHEREVHCAMQMSQSCEDLRIVTEGWSFKSRDVSLNQHIHV